MVDLDKVLAKFEMLDRFLGIINSLSQTEIQKFLTEAYPSRIQAPEIMGARWQAATSLPGRIKPSGRLQNKTRSIPGTYSPRYEKAQWQTNSR